MHRYAKAGVEPEGNYVSVIAMLLHPFSRGSTHRSDSDPLSAPVIDHAYLSDPLHAEILARHVVQIEQLLKQPSLHAVLRSNGSRYPAEFSHGTRNQEEAKAAIKRYGATNYHLCGTCAIT